MPRNRTITASEAVYVGPSPATGYMLSIGGTGGTNLLSQLHRVQSANYSVNTQRTEVNQFGQIAALDRIILNPPTVSLNIDYLVNSTYNSDALGFTVDGTAGSISGILAKTEDEKNYFISTVRGDVDAIQNTDASSTKFTIGIGNGFLSNFTAQGSVGNFATESVTVEALNLVTYIGATGLHSPAVIPSGGSRVSGPGILAAGQNLFTIPTATSGVADAVSAIRPGDITISMSDPVLGPSISDAKIQSYNISVPLSRTPIQKLGSPFPFTREINFPVNVTCGIEAELGDLVTGDISSLFCNDASTNITINLRKPSCTYGAGAIAVQYRLLGCKLESQNYQSQIGNNKRVSLSYVTTVGGPSDTVSNLYISGTSV